MEEGKLAYLPFLSVVGTALGLASVAYTVRGQPSGVRGAMKRDLLGLDRWCEYLGHISQAGGGGKLRKAQDAVGGSVGSRGKVVPCPDPLVVGAILCMAAPLPLPH